MAKRINHTTKQPKWYMDLKKWRHENGLSSPILEEYLRAYRQKSMIIYSFGVVGGFVLGMAIDMRYTIW